MIIYYIYHQRTYGPRRKYRRLEALSSADEEVRVQSTLLEFGRYVSADYYGRSVSADYYGRSVTVDKWGRYFITW